MEDTIYKSKLYKSYLEKLTYFKNELPEADELVRAKVTKIGDTGIICFLPEYKTEAFLTFQEASNSKKLYRIKQQYSINKTYIAKVSCVDYEKKYIDISTRNVFDDEKKEFENNIKKYELLLYTFVKSYIFKQTSTENINDFLKNTIKNIKLSKINNLIKDYYKNNTIFEDKFEKIKEKIDLTVFYKNLKKSFKKPVYTLSCEISVNSLSPIASKDIIMFITNINKNLKLKFKFNKGSSFKSKTQHQIKDNITDDTKNIKNKILDYYKNINISQFHFKIIQISICEI